MIDGGSYRDCGCDRPQLVDNVGEIGGEPHSRVGTRRWVGSGGLIPFATRLDAAQTRMSLSERISAVASHVHGPVGLARPSTKTTIGSRGRRLHVALRAQQGGDANHVDLRLPTIGDAGDAHPPEDVQTAGERVTAAILPEATKG